MAANEQPAKAEAASKEAIPRGSVATALSGMQNQKVLWADPEIAGYLEKRGGRFTSWKRRYFILQGYFLYYFISEQQLETPLGLIPIEGCTIKETTDMGGKLRRYVFYINVGPENVGLSRSDTYILAAASRELLEEWLEKLVLSAETREELYGDLRDARAVVGEIKGLLALSSSQERLFASLQGAEARALQIELATSVEERDELLREIEGVTIEADRQESALLQQLILWDIMSLTDPGREPNEAYPTLSRLQDEVRYSDEIYRLLYKRGSLFQGEGLQDLKKEYRALVVCLVRQVLDLIEDHHAKIRAKAPRYSFNVNPSTYEDMFYIKVPVQDEEQASLQLLERASKVQEDSDEDEHVEDEGPRKATVPEPITAAQQGRRASARQSSQQVPRASIRKSLMAAQQARKASIKQSPLAVQSAPKTPAAMPKLFPNQRAYQLTRSASQGWQVTPAGGGPPIAPPVLKPANLRKRTQVFENPHVFGSTVTGRTIADVTTEAVLAGEEHEAAVSENALRNRIMGIRPIFISHFGPETRPPASQVQHDVVSTLPIPSASAAEASPSLSQPLLNRPNVLAYIQGTIPRPKSVAPVRPSQAAAAAAAANQQGRPSTMTPPRSRPSSPDLATPSTTPRGKSISATPSTTPRAKSVVREQPSPPESVSADTTPPKSRPGAVEASSTSPPRSRPTVSFGPVETAESSASSSSQSAVRKSPPRARSVVKFADESAPGVGKASFISVDLEALDKPPSYGRIRDFPVLVPSILNSDVGLVFNASEVFSPEHDDEADEGNS